jgi:hypothetical protein
LGWPRRTYAHEPGATAVTAWLGIAFSTDWLSTYDLGQDVVENARKSKGISEKLDEWVAIAKDRSKWRQLTHSIPKPLDA